MARCEHLPIYKASLDVTLHLERVVAGFSRCHKHTLDMELRALRGAHAPRHGDTATTIGRRPVGALDRGGGRRRHAAQAAPDS